jgi:hypothetical protein
MAQAIARLEPLLIPEEIPVAGTAAEGMLLDDTSTVVPNRVFCQGKNQLRFIAIRFLDRFFLFVFGRGPMRPSSRK